MQKCRPTSTLIKQNNGDLRITGKIRFCSFFRNFHQKSNVGPDANFELMSYNPFSVNDNFFNSESDPDINLRRDISPLDIKYFSPNEIREGFECFCKNDFYLAHKHQEYK